MTLNDYFNQLIKNLQFLTKEKLSPTELDFLKSLVRQTQTSIAIDDDLLSREKFLKGSFLSRGDSDDQPK